MTDHNPEDSLAQIRIHSDIGSLVLITECCRPGCGWAMIHAHNSLNLINQISSDHLCRPVADTAEIARWRRGLAEAEAYRDRFTDSARRIMIGEALSIIKKAVGTDGR